MKLIRPEDQTSPSDAPLFQHCIWFGGLLDHHILSIASVFATQKNPRVILWTDADSQMGLSRLSQIFAEYPFEVRVGEFEECQRQSPWTFRSDKWRVQALRKFGGIYFDLDVLFLKDLSWFSTYGKGVVQEGFASEGVFNSALMYYPAGHPDLEYWNDRMGTVQFDWNALMAIQKTSDPHWTCDLIPNEVTDNGWISGGLSCDNFFGGVGMSPSLLDGSIAQHWHNRWGKSVRTPGTIVGFFWNKFVEQKLKI